MCMKIYYAVLVALLVMLGVTSAVSNSYFVDKIGYNKPQAQQLSKKMGDGGQVGLQAEVQV